jgi:hypothetical protein
MSEGKRADLDTFEFLAMDRPGSGGHSASAETGDCSPDIEVDIDIDVDVDVDGAVAGEADADMMHDRGTAPHTAPG